MRLIITRPLADARQLASKLEHAGHTPLLVPLLDIVPRPHLVIPDKPWQAICITSANATRSWQPFSHLLSTPVLAIGEQSRVAAELAGYQNVAAQGGDVEGLLTYIQSNLDPSKGPLLYVSGAETSGDLEGHLTRAGFAVHRAIVYDAQKITPPNLSGVISSADGVLFYSPRTVSLWMECVTENGMAEAAGRLTHYCLSHRVANRLPGNWQKNIAAEPTEQAILAMLAPAKKQE